MLFRSVQEETTPDNQIPDDVVAAIQSAGLSTDDLVVKTEDVNPFDGVDASEKVFYAEGDIRFTMDDIEHMAHDVDGEVLDMPNGEQYRTNNLVSVSGSTRTISVVGYTGSGFALTSRMRTGLQWAINNYNRENLRLRFTLSFAASTNADIVVYNNGAAGGGGSAGFPSGGNPNKFVQINAGTQSFSNNVNEHVIGHEIGHSIGFRHTDYFNRSISCGSGGNEGSGGFGAIHIPGTPTTNVNGNTSLMLACFNNGVDGEFTSSDVTALNFLY